MMAACGGQQRRKVPSGNLGTPTQEPLLDEVRKGLDVVWRDPRWTSVHVLHLVPNDGPDVTKDIRRIASFRSMDKDLRGRTSPQSFDEH